MLPTAPPKSASGRAWGVELGRWLASALLPLGVGLAIGALFAPWWHYANDDGSSLPNPGDAGAFIPAVTWGLGNKFVLGLLGFVVVAGVMGLVALVLPRRKPDALEAPASVALIMGLLGLGLAVLSMSFGFTDSAVIKIEDSGYYLYLLGCALILAGAWALTIIMRRSRAFPTKPAGIPSPALDHDGV